MSNKQSSESSSKVWARAVAALLLTFLILLIAIVVLRLVFPQATTPVVGEWEINAGPIKGKGTDVLLGVLALLVLTFYGVWRDFRRTLTQMTQSILQALRSLRR